jgi:tRNA(Ile)-lysidine synthase
MTEAWPPECWCDVTVLVAVSGGADSVGLLRALQSLRCPGPGRLVVIHFNHGLRGAESDGDEHFVKHLSGQLGLTCDIGRARLIRESGGCVSEEAAREARYAYFCEVAGRLGARFVATGHTADDQAETVLHRVLRGTGIGGLAGIRRHRELLPGVSLIRPLLGVRRGKLLEYLVSLGQDYRQDSSNQRLDFTRNRLRHDLIPRLEVDYNAQLIPALGRLAFLAAEVGQWIDQQVNGLLTACVDMGGRDQTAPVIVDCQVLSPVQPLLVRELFVAIWKIRGWPRQAMGFVKWDDLASLTHAALEHDQRRTLILPGGVRAERMGHRLTLQRINDV